MEPLRNIQNALRRFVDGEIDYSEFRLWIVDVYASYAAAEESAELRLCRAIEWEIADFSEGLISPELLKQSLGSLCKPNEESTSDVPVYTAVKVPSLAYNASVLVDGTFGSTVAYTLSASGSFLPFETLPQMPPPMLEKTA